MGFLDYLKFNCCAGVCILKFCHLKIVSGAVDAWKCCAKWRNWNISDIFFSLSSIEGRKQRRRPETFAPCTGTMPSVKALQEIGFIVLRRIVLTLVILHVQEDLRSFDEDCLNTLIQNYARQCTRELANVMNCDHSTIVRRLHSLGKIQKSGVWVPHALSQNHISASLHLCLLHGRLARWIKRRACDVTSPTSQLILQPFRRFTYVTSHSPTLPLLHLLHSSFSNPSFASPTSQALHLIHLASRPWFT